MASGMCVFAGVFYKYDHSKVNQGASHLLRSLWSVNQAIIISTNLYCAQELICLFQPHIFVLHQDIL